MYSAVVIIHKLRNILMTVWLIKLYNSHNLNNIICCLINWGNAAKCHLSKIAVVQKWALKIILKPVGCTNFTPVFASTHTLPIQDLFHVQCLIFTCKYINSLLLPRCQDILTFHNEVSFRNTRNTNPFYVHHAMLEAMKKSISHMGVSLWNSSPVSIKEHSIVNPI